MSNSSHPVAGACVPAFHEVVPVPLRQAASWAVLLTALSLPWSMPLQAAPLTEAEALRLAVSRPEVTDLARARRDEAAADVTAARTWTNPSLELTHDRIGDSEETTWQLAVPVDLSGRRSLRESAAHRRSEASAAEQHAWQGERSAEVSLAFYDVLRRQAEVGAVAAWAARFATLDTVVAKLARAGEVAGYDRRRLERERQTAEARLAESRAELERRRARLAALIGQAVTDDVAGRLLPDPPPELAVLRERLAQRPDLNALARRAEAARTDLDAARRQWPEITLGVGRKLTDDGLQRDTGPQVLLSFELPLFERGQADQQRGAAQALAAQTEGLLAFREAEAELPGLHRQLTALMTTAERYRQEAVHASGALIRIAEIAYRAGESSVLELLDAYQGALEAERTAIDLEWQARSARIDLDQLTGSYAP